MTKLGTNSKKEAKKIKVPKPVDKKELEELWKEVIKARAGYKSELSGAEGRQIGGTITLTAHHIVSKPNDALRFLELDNGICLDNGSEHLFGVHNKHDVVRARKYQDLIIEHIGKERYEKLLAMRTQCAKKKTDLVAARLFLQQKLAEYKK
jgi:hypothetical protein